MRIGVALTPNADEHQKLIESGRAIDRAAEAAGRDPAEILRLWNVVGVQSAEVLAGWASEHNVDGFVFWFDTSDLGAAVEQVERLGGLRAELG